jgi:hypothetical protein
MFAIGLLVPGVGGCRFLSFLSINQIESAERPFDVHVTPSAYLICGIESFSSVKWTERLLV